MNRADYALVAIAVAALLMIGVPIIASAEIQFAFAQSLVDYAEAKNLLPAIEISPNVFYFKGENYNIIEDYNTGEATWISTEPRLLDYIEEVTGYRYYADHIVLDNGSTIKIETLKSPSIVFDKNTCAYTLYNSGKITPDSQPVLPAISWIARSSVVGSGEWQDLDEVNNASCQSNVIQTPNGYQIEAIRTVLGDRIEPTYVELNDPTITSDTVTINGTSYPVTELSRETGFFLNGVYNDISLYTNNSTTTITDSDITFVNTVNGTSSTYDLVTFVENGYTFDQIVSGDVKFRTFHRIAMGDEIKESFIIENNDSIFDNHTFGATQTIHTGQTLTIGDNTFNIQQANGQRFDKDWIIENKGTIMEVADSIDYDFDVGLSILDSIFISYDNGVGKVSMDYDGYGGIVPVGTGISIDPSFSLTGTSPNTFDLTGLNLDTVALSSATFEGSALSSQDLTSLQTAINNGDSTWTYSSAPSNDFVVTSGGNVEALVVAGGGAGGGGYGGGGGAGGLLYSASKSVTPQTYTITVGDGGHSQIFGTSQYAYYLAMSGENGGNSVFDTMTAIGGGGGRNYYSNIQNGGSGGGGSVYCTGAGSGTAGQGNNGADGVTCSGGSPSWGAGGGGGAGGAGSGVNGGAGLQYSISGTAQYYAGGGGGARGNGSPAGSVGGSGVGGAGTVRSTDYTWTTGTNPDYYAGDPNTGSGGGGSEIPYSFQASTYYWYYCDVDGVPTPAKDKYNTNGSGDYLTGCFVANDPTGYMYATGRGGSGTVIISYPTGSISATGGTVTTSGSNTIHTFTYLNSSPTLTANYVIATVPTAPTNLVATDGLPVGLSYSVPSDDGFGNSNGAELIGYKVYRADNPNAQLPLPDNGGSNGGLDFTDNELLLHAESFGGQPDFNEEFTTDTWTHVGVQSVTNNQLKLLSPLDGTDNTSSKSLGTLNGNFVLRFEATPSYSGWSSGGSSKMTWFGLVDSVGASNTSHDWVLFGFEAWSSGNQKIGGYVFNSNSIDHTNSYLGFPSTGGSIINFVSGTTYYCEIIKNGDDHIFKIYSDSSYSTLLGSLTKTVTNVSGLQYLIGLDWKNSVSNNASYSNLIDNIKLYDGVTSVPTPTTPDSSPNTLTVTASSGSTTTGFIDNGISAPNLEVTSSLLPDSTDSFTVGSWVKQTATPTNTKLLGFTNSGGYDIEFNIGTTTADFKKSLINTSTTSQGNNGGSGESGGQETNTGGGGGGGAGGVGESKAGTGAEKAGNGGIGLQSDITGTLTYYAGGGGGGTWQNISGSNSGGSGGAGGGGNGGDHYSNPSGATAGTNGLGGGGGGAGATDASTKSGGSGVVILQFTTSGTSYSTTGSPVVDTSSVAGKTILKYLSSGTFTISSGTPDVRYLVIGGGGGGGGTAGGGGGGGGFITGTKSAMSAGTYTVTVGAGGAGATSNTSHGSNGQDSEFDGYVANGGGGGGHIGTSGGTGNNGGSGGGGGGRYGYAGGTTFSATLTDATIDTILSATGLADNTSAYHHYALTRDGSSWTLYQDGSSVATATDSTDLGSASYDGSTPATFNQSTSTGSLSFNSNVVTKTGATSWSTGTVVTNETFNPSNGGGYIECQKGTTSNTGFMCGFTSNSAPTGYQQTTFAMYMEYGEIYENGVYIKTYSASNPENLKIVIESNGVVNYYADGSLVHTSTITASGTYYGFVTLATNGASVTLNPSFTVTNPHTINIDGSIDEYFIDSTALTSAEINNAYDRAGTFTFLTNPNQATYAQVALPDNGGADAGSTGDEVDFADNELLLHGDFGGQPDFEDDFSSYTTQAEANAVWETWRSSRYDVNLSTDQIDVNIGSYDSNLPYMGATQCGICTDLGLLDDNQWVIRFKTSDNTWTAPPYYDITFYWVVSDGHNNIQSTQDVLGMAWRNNVNTSGTYTPAGQQTGIVYQDSSGAWTTNYGGIDQTFGTLSTGQTYYHQLTRVSATSFKVEIFSDSNYSSIVTSGTVTIPSTIQNLRWLKFQELDDDGNGGGFRTKIDDIEVYNGVNSVPTPTAIDSSPNTLTVTANSGTTTTGVISNAISTPNLSVTSSLLPDGTDSFTVGSWVKHALTRVSTLDGTQIGGVTTSATGKIDSYAWDFDGSNDYVNVSGVTLPTYSSTDTFSVSTWINMDTLAVSPNHHQRLFHWYDGTKQWQLYITSSGAISIDNTVASQGVTTSSTGLINTGTWYHVVAVKTGANTYKIYLNGVDRSTTNTGGGNPAPSTQTFRIGADIAGSGSDGHFNGRIDQFLLYNKALSQSEVTSLYNSGSGTTTVPTTNLVMSYNFEQTGSTLENQVYNPPTNTKLFGFTNSNGDDVAFNVGTTTADFYKTTTTTGVASPDYETDFSSNTGWTTSNSASIDITNNELQYKNNYNGNYIYYDLGSVSDTDWVLRWEWTATGNASTDDPAMQFAIYSYIGDMNDSGDGLGAWSYFDRSNTWSRTYCAVRDSTTSVQGLGCTSGGSGTSSGTVHQAISKGTKYYIEAIRSGGSTFEVNIRTGSHSGTLVTTLSNPNVPSTITNLRYLTGSHYIQGTGVTIVLDNVEFYNGVSDVNNAPIQTPVTIISATGLTDNTSDFQHYALSRDGSSWTLYQNGASVATATDSTNLGTVSGSHKINLDGSIDEYFIDSTALSATEIQNIDARGETTIPYTTTSLTFNDNTVVGGEDYAYRVSALNDIGESTYSNVDSAATVQPANAPTGMTATDVNNQSSLSWNQSSDLGGGTVQGYSIQKSTDDVNWTLLAQTSTTATTYTDTNVSLGNTYYYRVATVNEAGVGAYSTSASVTIADPPDPPTNLTVTPLANAVLDLSFTAPANNGGLTISGYEIERSIDGGATYSTLATNVQTTTYSDTGLNIGDTYYYRVLALNAQGASTPSGSASGVAGDVPDAVADLTAQAVPGNQILLNWSIPNENAYPLTQYDLYVSENGGAAVKTTIIPPNNTYTLINLNAGSVYDVTVTSSNQLGTSGTSNTATATSGDIPTVPTNLSATVVPGGQIDLSWNASTSPGYAVTYNLEISTDGGATWTTEATQSGTTYSDTGLTNGNTYYYRVSATNTLGTSNASTTVNAKAGDVPDAPASVSVAPLSATELSIGWTVPNDNGYTLTGYDLERSLDNTNWTSVATNLQLNTYSDSGLTQSTTYYYRVTATNALGTSAYSNSGSGQTFGVPNPVNTLALTPQSTTQIDLTWSAPSMNGYSFTEYQIERSFDGTVWNPLATTTNTFYYDQSLTANVQAYYRVAALNAYGLGATGNEPSSQTYPTAPATLTATTFSDTRIDLVWNNPAGSAHTGFKIEQSTDSGATWSVIVGNTGNVNLSYSVTGLQPVTTYDYRVSTINPSATSTPSSTATATTYGPPAAPTNLTATPQPGAQIQLDWTAPTTTNGAAVSDYQIERSTDGVNFSVLTTTGNTNITYTDTGLTTATTYYYRVAAINTYGSGSPSNVANAVASDVPSQVTGLTATALTNFEIKLDWTAPNANGYPITSYKIERSIDAGVTWNVLVANTASTAVTYTDINLTSGTDYYYRVSATNNVGTGSASVSANVIAGSVPGTPSLTLTPQAGGQIDLTWTTPANNAYAIINYDVERSPDGTTWTALTTLNGNTYSDTGLIVGDTYHYRVAARNSIGLGAFSTSQSQVAGNVPGIPTLLATVASNTQINLSWSSPSANSYPVTGYFIEQSADNITWTTLVANTQSTSLTYAATGLTPATDYYFRVSGINQLGTGQASASQLAHTYGPPDAMAAPTATSTTTSNTVNWVAPYDNGSPITNFRVEVLTSTGSWATLSTVQSTTLTYTQNNVLSNTLYTYRVTATNAYGTSVSPIVEIHSKPIAPVLSGTTVSGTQIDLSWTTQSGVTVTYNLYKSGDGVTYAIQQSGITATTLSDAALAIGDLRYYKVSAVNVDGEGPLSSALQISTFSLPSAPQNIQITNPTPLEARVSWTLPSDNGGDTQAMTYNVERSLDNINWTLIAQPALTYYVDSGLSATTTYYYKVSATNRAGDGPYTSSVSYTTPALPGAPTNLVGTPTGSTNSAVKLEWGAGSSTQQYPLFGYQIDRRTNGGSWDTIVANTGNTLTVYTNTNLSGGNTYEYRVYSISAVGVSATSTNIVSVQMLDIDLNLTGQALTGNTVELTSSVVVNGGNPLPDIVQIAVYQNNARIDLDSVTLTLQNQALQTYYAYPTTTSDFYMTITLANGYTVKSNTIPLTPTAPFSGELSFEEYRDPLYEESTLELTVQPFQSDVIVRYQPQNLNEPAILRGFTSAGTQTLNIDLIGQQGDPTYNPDASETDYYGSVYVNPSFDYTINPDGSVTNNCDPSSTLCDPDDVPNGTPAVISFKSFKSPDATQQLGIEPMGNLFGVNMIFLFVVAIAGIFTGRSAPMGVIFILAILGIMTYLGYLDFSSPDATWALLVIAALAGIFVGKRWS